MVTALEARNLTARGAKDSAERTYASVKAAFDQAPGLKRYDYEVFLQGSYANATNIRGDSDVDIVAMLKSTYMPDLELLSSSEKRAYQADSFPGTVRLDDFRGDVHRALTSYYGSRRVSGKDKCIRIDGENGYLDADVVPSYQVRRYRNFSPSRRGDFIEGIEIRPQTGGSVVNYPKEHRRNGAAKNARCHERFKGTVRQVKRLAVKGSDAGHFGKSEAPGYLLECLAYNVSDDWFVADDRERLIKALAYILVLLENDDYVRAISSCDGVHRLFVDDPGGHDAVTAHRVIRHLLAMT